MRIAGWSTRSAPYCWVRPGSAHLLTSALGGRFPSVTSAARRGPWQRDLRGRAADPSLPAAAGSVLASGSRASSTEMSVRPSRPRGDRTRRARCMESSNTTDLGVDEVFVGIDWGASHHQLCAVNATGQRQRQVRLSHDVAGLNQLDAELAPLGTGLPVCVERAEGLLVERLQAGGHRVFPVNPRIAARAPERYRVGSSKDDVFDAFTLADTLRHEHPHWRPLPCPSLPRPG